MVCLQRHSGEDTVYGCSVGGEVIFEEGVLSGLITEVVHGLGNVNRDNSTPSVSRP